MSPPPPLSKIILYNISVLHGEIIWISLLRVLLLMAFCSPKIIPLPITLQCKWWSFLKNTKKNFTRSLYSIFYFVALNWIFLSFWVFSVQSDPICFKLTSHKIKSFALHILNNIPKFLAKKNLQGHHNK